MIRTDHAALEFIVETAREAGFSLEGCEVAERLDDAPLIHLILRQSRATPAHRFPADQKEISEALQQAVKAELASSKTPSSGRNKTAVELLDGSTL